MSERSTDHASFTIERTLAHPPERVFRSFADQASKARWFIGPDRSQAVVHELDFRPGGHERLQTRFDDGTDVTFDATYHDIVADERIIYAYEMHVGGRRISVSLASIELAPTRGGTHLAVIEHGIYLDGLDQVSDRERGTRELLDNLAAALDAVPA